MLHVSVVPKATLKFDDSPEGLTELRGAVTFIFMAYYSKRYTLKSVKDISM